MTWYKSINTLFAVFFFLISANLTTAAKTTIIEQQINLLNQTYITSSLTAAPTTNELGLSEYDSSVYTSPTVYFEAVLKCSSCTGGNEQAKATLYDSNGTPVTNAFVVAGNGNFTRARTSAITDYLTDNHFYTVRLSVDADSGTATLITARLIIIQNSTAISLTRVYPDLGDADTSTSTSYSLLTNPKIFYYSDSRLIDIDAIYFEATLASSDGSGVAYAALSSNSTCSTTVTDSEVSLTGTAWGLDRSIDIKANLTNNTEYWLCLKSSSGDTAYIANAHLVIDQANETGIDLISAYQTYNPTLFTDNDTTYTESEYYNQYNPSNFNADRTYAYFESVLNSDSGTGYVELYNTTDTTSISGSELSHDSSAYTRKVSSNLYSSLPTSAKTLDIRAKNGSTNLTSLSQSWLILVLEALPDPALTFTLNSVDAGSVNNDITTSVASTFNTLPFGNLSFSTPKYTAHQLYVSSNAASGYGLSVKMLNYLQGNYPANNIDPFIADWNSPTTWTEPTGITPNDNTGWIGANTTDSRVSGWDSASQKFGPINSSPNLIMYTTTEDSGTTAYVTYAVEVNIWQPADLYGGTLVYNLTPIY